MIELGPWSVSPSFSSPVSTTTVELNLCENIKTICENQIWIEDTEDTGTKGFYSENRNVLDNHLKIKQELESICFDYIDQALGYDTNIKITTSWFTKTSPGGYCVEHCHCNSWFSSVLYFDEYTTESSGLLFVSNPPPILVNPKRMNVLNSNTLTIFPEKGKLVIFPSSMRHRVLKHNGSEFRYSLSFNIMPKGIVGIGDSSFVY